MEKFWRPMSEFKKKPNTRYLIFKKGINYPALVGVGADIDKVHHFEHGFDYFAEIPPLPSDEVAS